MKRNQLKQLASLLFFLLCVVPVVLAQKQTVRGNLDQVMVSGWRMQDATKLSQQGEVISSPTFDSSAWYPATVPGTVLTTLVDNHVYPEPTYGENNRPEIIPDSLASTPFWYRAVVGVPKNYKGKHIWLHFDGVNYSAVIWVNGTQIGLMRGAFRRGTFDISQLVKPGKKTALAVLVSPQPHPGVPHEHTLRDGVGRNGGATAIDGPTFLSTIGWDWLATVPDRDTGIWRKVFLSASGPVLVKDPFVTTDLSVPGFETAGITVQSTLENVTDQPQTGVLIGSIGDVTFQRNITLPPHGSEKVAFNPSTTPSLLFRYPRLWWPNGYGAQDLYKLRLTFKIGDQVSQSQDVAFGVHKITYSVPSTNSLAFVVNGVPIFIRGGDWGLDEALKRIPRERLEAQVRMHQLTNLNMVRNWVGQSTSEDFFELCDKYGLLVWDEFFQPNPDDGPDPTDVETYMANVRDTLLRFRNHPSIVLWCARNEGDPPKEIDAALRDLLNELDPTRLYQANSSDGRGLRSHGPYRWRVPRDFYWLSEGFKSETGSMSVPTIESIQGMLPKKDWETITDAWAQHDFAKGAVGGDLYPGVIASRYGKIKNLADFVRKAQLANYEAFRAMYEGRNAELFHPTTGILTWMSHPAQPSFVWQLYHYDLEPNASFFAVKSASEMVHIQFNEVLGTVQVINNYAASLYGATGHAEVFNLDGTLSSEQNFTVDAAPSSAATLGQVEFHGSQTTVHFVRLRLHDSAGKLLSENFYWLNHPERADQFAGLGSMSTVQLETSVKREDRDGKTFLNVGLHNPTGHIALMTHLQLRRQKSGERVLPVFYDRNYISLVGGETKNVVIECDTNLLKGDSALVVVDGWNASVAPSSSEGASVTINENAQVDHWPHTGLPFQTEGLR